MANPMDMINYLFGVTIVTDQDVLYVEDRRPTMKMTLAVCGMLGLVVLVAWGWATNRLIVDSVTIPFIAGAFLGTSYFIVKGNFRETYVFNKKSDSYTFTRESIMKKDIIEGSSSQFGAVEVQKKARDSSGLGGIDLNHFVRIDSLGENYIYSVVLLMQGMLLGRSDTQILRDDPPIFSSQAAEERIASAIAKFLGIPRKGVVDVS